MCGAGAGHAIPLRQAVKPRRDTAIHRQDASEDPQAELPAVFECSGNTNRRAWIHAVGRFRRRGLIIRLGPGGLCLSLIVVLLLTSPIAAAGEWGHKLPNLPTQFVFGYGSLLDADSRDRTAGAALPAIPVRVSAAFGYLRAWVDRCSCGFTGLGLRKARSGEAATTINGVIFAVDGSSLSTLDRREDGYRRVPVPLSLIEAVSWQELPRTGQIWVYVPIGSGGEPGVELPEPTVQFPMLQSYIDVVLRGALTYGTDFASEVIETTTDWSIFWLNDREMPRRPWIHTSDYQIIDNLLKQVAPASGRFNDRLFPEDFAAKRLADPGAAR